MIRSFWYWRSFRPSMSAAVSTGSLDSSVRNEPRGMSGMLPRMVMFASSSTVPSHDWNSSPLMKLAQWS